MYNNIPKILELNEILQNSNAGLIDYRKHWNRNVILTTSSSLTTREFAYDVVLGKTYEIPFSDTNFNTNWGVGMQTNLSTSLRPPDNAYFDNVV